LLAPVSFLILLFSCPCSFSFFSSFSAQILTAPLPLFPFVILPLPLFFLFLSSSTYSLFHWAAYADKYGGTVQETTLYGATVKVNEPVGVIGIACPEEYPLLGFVSLFAPAVVRGNTVVVIPSQKYPISAVDLYQVFETSDVPAGVVNIVTGNSDHLAKYLVEHQDIDAMWYFGSAEGSRFIEFTSAGNVKRTWVNYGYDRDWLDAQQGQGEEFLLHSTECKNIWLPMGTIFAN
jgi:aldehyde dehydrogenase (NAD+)